MEYYNLTTYNMTCNLGRWYAFSPNDNSEYTTDLQYPKEIVRKWLEESRLAENYNGCKEADDPCEEWVNNYYMISDIDDLYAYAKDHGCKWTRTLTIAGIDYTLDDLAKKFNGEICIGDPYGKGDDNTPFWDWIDSLYSLHVIREDTIEISYRPIHTYTVVFDLKGRVTVNAASEEEARCIASGMPIEFDEVADIINTIKED